MQSVSQETICMKTQTLFSEEKNEIKKSKHRPLIFFTQHTKCLKGHSVQSIIPNHSTWQEIKQEYVRSGETFSTTDAEKA